MSPPRALVAHVDLRSTHHGLALAPQPAPARTAVATCRRRPAHCGQRISARQETILQQRWRSVWSWVEPVSSVAAIRLSSWKGRAKHVWQNKELGVGVQGLRGSVSPVG